MAGRYTVLVTFAYAMTLDRHAAEDLAQSALVAAYPRWRTIDNADAYLKTTITRLVYRRGRSRLREVLLPAPREIAVDDDTRAVDGADGLLQQLTALPPRQRAVLVLRYLDDTADDEIARMLGISVGTVRSQAARGLDKLRSTAYAQKEGTP